MTKKSKENRVELQNREFSELFSHIHRKQFRRHISTPWTYYGKRKGSWERDERIPITAYRTHSDP